jgi:hypothetical protein
MAFVFKELVTNQWEPKPTTDSYMEGIFVTRKGTIYDKILTFIRIFFWILHMTDVKFFFSNSEVKQETIHGKEPLGL